MHLAHEMLKCELLGIILPSTTSYSGNASYVQQEKYWSQQQAETQPTCRVQPSCPLDVSASLIVTKFFGCQFAVKSGGHAAFVGASNIQGGLTIDLANLNQVQVSKDRTLTQVGAGNRWVDVYSQLDPLGLSVIGGRVADIGVGGLTLGGMRRRSKLIEEELLILPRRHILLLWSPRLGLRQCQKLSGASNSRACPTQLLSTASGRPSEW